MTRGARSSLAAVAAMLTALLLVGAVSAHPLGNYTVNRAVVVRIEPTSLEVRYVIDMAEIPTFSEMQKIDANGDGQADTSEELAYATGACDANRAALLLEVDGRALALANGVSLPQLSFPAGAGGLRTLRLVCEFAVSLPGSGTVRELDIADRTDDGHVGWREVTIAASAGVEVESSSVAAVSRSAELTHYPVDSLQSPPDVRSGRATFRLVAGAGGNLLDDPAAPKRRVTANDPLAGLVGGRLAPPLAILALLLAVGLGALHAVSPGHGKTLVAAYLIGSQGSMRHAATLGLTVAATHTAGVFLLGVVTLAAGQFLVPERVIGWLSIGSGILVIMLGSGLVIRALRAAGARRRARANHDDHDHDHAHAHANDDGHSHAHGHPHAPALRPRNVVALGLAGGMVPSGSALIVLLVAVTTDRVLFGVLLIVAFGIGMALVLGGLAAGTTLARRSLVRPSGLASRPLVRWFARAIPLVSGLAVLGAGLAVTVEAIARFA
jgi:nickel/cobalt exporter